MSDLPRVKTPKASPLGRLIEAVTVFNKKHGCDPVRILVDRHTWSGLREHIGEVRGKENADRVTRIDIAGIPVRFFDGELARGIYCVHEKKERTDAEKENCEAD